MNETRIKLSVRAASYLRRVANEEGASLKLTARDYTAANELRDKDLAIFIPVSSGGSEVALTNAGIREAAARTVGKIIL